MNPKHRTASTLLGGVGSASVMLNDANPTQMCLVTYFFLLNGILLGVISLGEVLSWQLAMDALLIISSVIIVNWKSSQTK